MLHLKGNVLVVWKGRHVPGCEKKELSLSFAYTQPKTQLVVVGFFVVVFAHAEPTG